MASEAKRGGGLEGVVAAETRLSDVDGERGRLILAGHDVEELASSIDFESACALLCDGALPTDARREEVRAAIAEGRAQAFERLPSLGDALSAADGMDALRAATAHLRAQGDDAAFAVIGAVAVFAAGWSRRATDAPPIPPDRKATHAEDFLRMVRDRTPSLAEVAALDAYLVTVIDHGMNASTFAARVVASTGSDLVSSIVAAIGALKGPLHGGAPGPVLDMLDRIGSADHAENWLQNEIVAGRRIMGMGHRIYRVRDPRAAVLERALLRLETASGVQRGGRLALARAVERAAEGVLRARHPTRPLPANVEFYTAVLLEAIGLPRALFTPTFAVARVVGWCAHVEEQRKTGRLIRPASRYVGDAPRGSSESAAEARAIANGA